MSPSLLEILYISSDQYVNMKPNLQCFSLSVCINTGNGSVMEAAPCGRAAAGRLKLQVERVRRRSCSMFPHCSKRTARKGRSFSANTLIHACQVAALLSPATERYITPAPESFSLIPCSRSNYSTYYTWCKLLFLTWCCRFLVVNGDKWVLQGKMSPWYQQLFIMLR